MLRKCATFAFGFALLVALTFAMAHAQPRKAPGEATGFSNPCGPALPAFQAGSEAGVVSTVDAISASPNTAAPAGAVRDARANAVAWPIPPQAPGAYPPLWHRPPPSHS